MRRAYEKQLLDLVYVQCIQCTGPGQTVARV